MVRRGYHLEIRLWTTLLILEECIKQMSGHPTDDIITSMLVPTKRLLVPSMDNSGNQSGKHNLLSMIDFDDAETPESKKKDDQEAQIQVLRKQPPPWSWMTGIKKKHQILF